MIYYHYSQNLFSQKLDFSDAVFFESIALLGERFASDPTLENEWKSWI
jgi:hypothetical protein